MNAANGSSFERRSVAKSLERGFTRRRALSLGALVAASILTGCPGATWTSYTTHWNGRLAVLTGGADASGARMGLWVYYDDNGAVEYERKFGNGHVITGTGIYEHGKRVRMPTSEELAAARVRADVIEQDLRRRP